jgi:maleamate amidohydrolase
MSGNWDAILTTDDDTILARGRAQRAGFGKSPALLWIDCQYYMAGICCAPDNATTYPLACGEVAFAAMDQMVRLLNAARPARIPIFFTRYVVNPVNDDVGMFHRKIGAGMGRSENLYLAGTHGAEIVANLKPLPNEIAIDKKKFSAFLETPLLSLLIDRRVGTLIIVGGSTSNCIRAAALDSTQLLLFHNRARGGVYDRLSIAHTLNLFDINRSYGDVMSVDEVLAHLAAVAT